MTVLFAVFFPNFYWFLIGEKDYGTAFTVEEPYEEAFKSYKNLGCLVNRVQGQEK